MRRHLLTGAVLLLATAAFGQGVILPERVIAPEPWPIPPHTEPLRVEGRKITATVRDGAATTVVEQTFHNQYNHRLEGMFLFPLPVNAGVTDFGMTVNGQMVGAELLSADKAKQVYEEIVRRQRDPGLLEYFGRDAFRARIFPIEPGETKTVRLEFTHAVEMENGLGRYALPMKMQAFEPRWGGPPVRPLPMARRDGDGRQLERRSEGATPPSGLVLNLTIESKQDIKSVYSPSHDVDVRRDDPHKVRVSFESRQVPDEDLVLFYQLSNAMFGLNLLTYRGGEDEGTFMLLLAPKSEVREQDIQAKDIVFVADVSGSMQGQKIDQTKAALAYCLRNLNPGDHFNVLSFSTDIDTAAKGLVTASRANVDDALKFVDQLKARGGTNIDEALGTALGMLPTEPDRPAMVLFLTDGQPTVGQTRPERILEDVGKANKAEARMFVFGVGDDLNVPLLDRLSEDNHGTRTYVSPGENIEASVSSLYQKINSPVLSDLRLDIQGVKVTDLQPTLLPDLFRGSQLTLLGRYSGNGPAKITLRGKANGKEQTFDYSGDFPERDRTNSFLPRLWATRRVGYLLEQIRLHGEEKELRDEVVRLATRYGILTPYTSYLVLEPGMSSDTVAQEALQGRRVSAAPTTGPGMPGGAAGAPGVPAYNAPAPTDAATGGGAVARSEGERKLKDAATTAPAQSGLAVQHAGGRTFYLVDETWVDSTYPKDPGDKPVIKVKYGSDAYFDLLGLRPELKELLAVGERLKVALPKALLVIGDDGDTTLSAAAKQAISAG